MKQYQLAMPQQVYSGETAMQALETLASGHEKAAVFTDAGIRASGILERPLAELDKAAVPYIINDTLPAEPTCDQAQQVIDTFRESNADLIVAVGGGSVMDIAKLASITADGSCTVRDQLKNPRIGKKTVTTVMIPTTAGTGSEATPNSIVAVPEEQLKVGIVNPEMIADAVILVATSPKSNSAHDAINAAIADVQAGRTGPIPRQLQNKHFDGEDALVKGQNYKYAHSYANHWVQQQYLPDVLKDTKYYTFGDNKTEQAARAYWAKIKGEENV